MNIQQQVIKITFVFSKLLLILTLCFIGYWLYVKFDISRNTSAVDTTWNDSRTCYANVYVVSFTDYGVMGRIMRLFSSPTFFRIYDKERNLLKTSEWMLLQKEAVDLVPIQWRKIEVFYPMSDGYHSWRFPSECY